MKRGNGSGSITKLSGNRRKKWRVRVTTGWSGEGKQIMKDIGTFETKKEAVQALEAYTTIDDQPIRMTLAEAWNGYSKTGTVKEGTLTSYRSAYRKCSQHYNTPLESFNLDIMQSLVDTPPATYATCNTMKKMLAAVLEYAFAHDGCPASRKDLLKYIVTPERPTQTKARRFTDDEINLAIVSHCVLAVVLLFTGLRREELHSLEDGDVDLDHQIIHVRTSKTAAGIRDVPIPDKLVPWVKELMATDFRQHTYTWMTENMWQTYPISHLRRHDCRHTYISILTESGVDGRLVKQLVGHAGGVTNDVYTHFDMSKKLKTVNRVFNAYLPNVKEHGESYDYDIHLNA